MQSRNKKRLLFPPPSVLGGDQREAQVGDFESLSKKAIGEGAFGEVYKVRHKESRELYAIKVVSKQKVISSSLLPQLRREIRIMYNLSHPHIIKLFNHFEDEKNFYIVLQLAQGGTLWQKLAKFKSFDEDTAAQYIREVILAVEYLHSRAPPIIHRDIKPENLLLDKEGRDGRIKLADFGWSNFFNNDRTRMTYCGTLDYLAPEMINQQGHSTKLDLWNIGVLLFQLLTGTAPFQASTQAAMFEKILKVRISFPKNFPPMAKDLITRLLRANPEQRLSLPEIMLHPWLQTHAPIRPTIVQHLEIEPLPCDLQGNQDITQIEVQDPIKPFEEKEYRVLSQPTQEETKQQNIVVNPAAPTSYTQQISTLETELKQTKDQSKKYKAHLEGKETELDKVNSRIKDLQATLQRLEGECQQKKKIEQKLKTQLQQKNQKIASMKAVQEDENKLYQEYQNLRAKSLEKETQLNLLKAQIENLEKMAQQKLNQNEQLDEQIQRVKSEIDQAKQRYSKSKSDMHSQFLKLETEVDILQQELQSKERDNSVVSLQALLNFTQQNLQVLKNKYRTQNELLRQYQEANDRLIQLDNKYTEMHLQYENDLAELKRRTNIEIKELQSGTLKVREDVPNQDIEVLRKRLNECIQTNQNNRMLQEELEHLNKMVALFDRSITSAQRHVDDLQFLRECDQKQIKSREAQISNLHQEINRYKRNF